MIFFCAASFQQAETGAEHQHKMPEVPQPEDIEPNRPLPAEVLERLPIKCSAGCRAAARSNSATSTRATN